MHLHVITTGHYHYRNSLIQQYVNTFQLSEISSEYLCIVLYFYTKNLLMKWMSEWMSTEHYWFNVQLNTAGHL